MFYFILNEEKYIYILSAHVRKCHLSFIFSYLGFPMCFLSILSLYLSCCPVSSRYSLLEPLEIVAYIRLGCSKLKFGFKIKICCQFWQFILYVTIATKATFLYFVLLKVGWFVEKFEKHKSLLNIESFFVYCFRRLKIVIYFSYFWTHVRVWKILFWYKW